MATGALISVEEYLSTSYRPDCDYVDGVVLERNFGEIDHSRAQALFAAYLCFREGLWGIVALTEQRVQVKPTRFRIPDICVLLGPGPFDPVIHHPPFVCIEFLSKDDTMRSMQDRIKDYLAIGVPYVWLIDPSTRQAYVYTSGGMYEAKDGVLRTENPEIVVPLAEIFKRMV